MNERTRKEVLMVRATNTLVLALSLLLLIYIGYGDAQRTYTTLALGTLGAEEELVGNALDRFLLSGQPLEQFPGFTPLTNPLIEVDPLLDAVGVVDPNGEVIFANPERAVKGLVSAEFTPLTTLGPSLDRFTVTEDETAYRLSQTLRNRFELVGTLHVLAPKALIRQPILSAFVPVLVTALGLLVAYPLLLSDRIRLPIAQHANRRVSALGKPDRWPIVLAGLCFSAVAVVLAISQVGLYEAGITAKTEAITTTLGARLNAAFQLDLTLDDFDTLDVLLRETRALDPSLSYVALVNSIERTVAHTDAARLDYRWQSPTRHFDYQMPLGDSEFALHVGVPTSVVYQQLWRSVKNFLALFVAAGFVATLLFNLQESFIGRAHATTARARQRFNLNLIRPLYFLVVFSERLMTSFLAPYFTELAAEAGANEGLVSTIFTCYFIGFVLALLPSGRLADQRGVKPVLAMGAVLVVASLVAMVFVTAFYPLFVVRFVAGLGQGMLYIGVQSYILQMSPQGRKTRAAAIIVFGYNGGMIAGTAIGGLLVINIGRNGVFITAALIALFILWYILRLIPHQAVEPVEIAQPQTSFFANFGSVFKDWSFVKTIFLIGMPTKAVLTGVAIFALPLVLAKQNFPQDDIGQVLMLYAAGVLLSSRVVSRVVDRQGETRRILFFGSVGAGIGLVIIGLIGWQPIAVQRGALVLIVMLGMFLLGIAHGFIHAPVVTHIANTDAATTLGVGSTTSLYRFLERMGHVTGPILVGQMLLLGGDSPLVIGLLGVAVMVLGALFVVNIRWPQSRTVAP